MPTNVRDGLKQRLWDEAGELGWAGLTDMERTAHYERWAQSPDVGGVLSRYMDPRRTRVYIKDSLLKPFLRSQMETNLSRVLERLEVDPTDQFAEIYIKPHGRRGSDGRVFCWGAARDWKLILISVFERAFVHHGAVPYGAVLIDPDQATDAETVRVIEEARRRLKIDRLEWL